MVAAASAPAPPPLKSSAVKKSPAKKKASKNAKAMMPEFPESVVDEQGVRFMRDVQLGQGGFARVYRVYGPDGVPHAFKCISKASLASKKNRAKMLAEMKIHRMLRHPNIVRYDEAFDDENNIYLKLELCAVGNMNDISKRRGGFTEAEARFWMIQILAGCQYMHISNVIHRDLKLGNIFLDSKMNVKIGDFGLAALLNFPSERKKTMCGTPNYIAPEILNEAGHSFEVDVWAVGVILYTLIVGKPPFQTNDVHGIYENIKRNYYSFPDRASISPEGKALVRRILTSNPADRPSLIDIMADPWFQAGPIPMSVPTSAVRGEPLNIVLPTNLPASMRNFEAIKASAGFRDDADDELPEEQVAAREGPKKSAREERREQERVEEERDRVTREFNEAIQPDAPWSLLLKAGRDPLVRAPTFSSQPTTTQSARSMPSLVKQLSALNIHRQTANGVPKGQGDHGVDKENAGPGQASQQASRGNMGPPSLLRSGRGAGGLLGGAPDVGGIAGGEAISAEERRMIGQKARLVAGMTAGSAVSIASTESGGAARRAKGGAGTDAESDADTPALASSSSSSRRLASVTASTSTKAAAAAAAAAKRSMSSVETIVQNVGDALAALDAREEYVPLREDGTPLEIPLEEVDDVDNGTRLRPAHPSVVIISWLDHSEKYGLGYALSDGSVGVHFRDSTSMSFNAKRSHFDYISQLRSRSASSNALTASSSVVPRDQLKRENFPLPEARADAEWAREATVGRDVSQKLKIMRFFEAEIMERLFGAENPLAWTDARTTSGMTFVHKWYRCKLAIVFRLSTGTVQFNFYDHHKLFLSRDGQVISCIEPVDKTEGVPVMRSWTLAELISIADLSRSEREASAVAEAEERGEACSMVRTRPAERKLARSLLKKLRYARDVLVNTLTARANVAGASAAAAKAAAAAGASNRAEAE